MVSLPSPPSITVTCGVGEGAVGVRDEDRVVAGAALDEDRRERRARERAAHDGAVEDLDLRGVTGQEPERDAVVGAVAGDLQLVADDGGRDRRGRDPRRHQHRGRDERP